MSQRQPHTFAHLRPIRHICRVCFAKRNKPDANQCDAPGESYSLISKADMLFPLYSNGTQTNTNMHRHWQRIWLNTHRLTRNAHFSEEALTKIRLVFSDSLVWREFISWSFCCPHKHEWWICLLSALLFFLFAGGGKKFRAFSICVYVLCVRVFSRSQQEKQRI